MIEKVEYWVSLRDYPVVRCSSLDEAKSKLDEFRSSSIEDSFSIYKLTIKQISDE